MSIALLKINSDQRLPKDGRIVFDEVYMKKNKNIEIGKDGGFIHIRRPGMYRFELSGQGAIYNKSSVTFKLEIANMPDILKNYSLKVDDRGNVNMYCLTVLSLEANTLISFYIETDIMNDIILMEGVQLNVCKISR